MAIRMMAQRLRHRVDIQNFTTTQDGTTGAVSDSWSNFDTDVPAEVLPMSGREFIASQSMQSGITTKITIRYQAGIASRMRVIHGTDIYNIKAVLADSSLRQYLTLMCEVGVES